MAARPPRTAARTGSGGRVSRPDHTVRAGGAGTPARAAQGGSGLERPGGVAGPGGPARLW
ncbi:hypothetical protein DFI_16695 (plasmid) [Deinococcus ficus]|uniref:Uncharacterized protein n=1 Tax=Deinococcus ficus TaxID=317577 RepID=A0A221T1Q9_9DEIO|nr:hypothetical protein DFI_16695 [Deinococcus ficus]